MAKTLFTMGSLKILSPQNMESSEYYNAVISLQKYLYRAVRSEEKPWASQSADEIIAAYKNVWSFVDRVKSSETEDQVLANREERKAKAQVVMNALGALRELQRQSIPSKQSAMSSQELLATLSKEELRMKNYLATEAAGTSLSKEAQKLEALKREGRVKSEESVLEKNAKKRLPNK
jgi:hypothetical protein